VKRGRKTQYLRKLQAWPKSPHIGSLLKTNSNINLNNGLLDVLDQHYIRMKLRWRDFNEINIVQRVKVTNKITYCHFFRLQKSMVNCQKLRLENISWILDKPQESYFRFNYNFDLLCFTIWRFWLHIKTTTILTFKFTLFVFLAPWSNFDSVNTHMILQRCHVTSVTF